MAKSDGEAIGWRGHPIGGRLSRLQAFGDNIDSEGKFTSYEILYRSLFDRWFLDKGLTQEFIRYVARHGQVGSSVIDLGAGGGH